MKFGQAAFLAGNPAQIQNPSVYSDKQKLEIASIARLRPGISDLMNDGGCKSMPSTSQS